MKYIDELVRVSNNELEFSKELLKVKEDISKSKRIFVSVNSFVKNINTYCETKIKDSYSENKDCILLNTNDFSMFMLNRLFLRIKKYYEIKEEALSNIFTESNLKSYIKGTMKNQFVDTVFLTMTAGFEESKDYYFERMSDEDYELFNFYNVFLKDMNLDIITELIEMKPIIFVGRDGKSSAILTELNILVFDLKDTIKYKNGNIDTIYVYEKLVNNIVDITMTILFNSILTEFNIDYLSKKYKIEKDDLSFEIGKELANYITDYKIRTELLKDVIEMSKHNLSKESLIEKETFKLMAERNEKISEDLKDVFN